MVGSTVYGFENELYQVVALLQTLGYEVLNSHVGTIKVNPKLSNLENCLNAVDECDLFLGIIRPYYGTGNIGEKNITFEEIKRAIELKKPVHPLFQLVGSSLPCFQVVPQVLALMRRL